MRAGLAIALIFVARFLAGAWFDPGRDGDIAWQHWLGSQIVQTGHLPYALGPEAFTAASAPWVPQEWALSLLVFWTVGTPFFPALVALAAAAAGTVLWFTALAAFRQGASTVAIVCAIFFAGESMLESYGIRAQVFGWALLAIVMYLLRCAPRARQWWIVALVVLWANLHASVLLAPALLALWTAGVVAEHRRWTSEAAHYALMTAASAVAVLLTPLGYRLPLYAIALQHSPIRAAITEWQPSSFTAPSFSAGALPLLVLAAWLLFTRRPIRWREIFICSATTWLAIAAVRNVPIAAIVAAPLAAELLSTYLPRRLRINTIFEERGARSVLYAGCAAAAALTVLTLVVSPQFGKNDLPSAAVAALASQPGSHHLYCEDFAWCSLALAYPNLQEFIDGRADPFPLAVWQDYVTIFHAKGDWRRVLERRGVDAVLVDKKRRLSEAISHLRNWHLLYADREYRLFVRDDSRSAAYQY